MCYIYLRDIKRIVVGDEVFELMLGLFVSVLSYTFQSERLHHITFLTTSDVLIHRRTSSGYTGMIYIKPNTRERLQYML